MGCFCVLAGTGLGKIHSHLVARVHDDLAPVLVPLHANHAVFNIDRNNF